MSASGVAELIVAEQFAGRVTAVVPGFGMAYGVVTAADLEVQILIDDAMAIRGVLLDSRGEPIGGVTVAIHGKGADSPWRDGDVPQSWDDRKYQAIVQTAPDGSFTVRGLPSGAYSANLQTRGWELEGQRSVVGIEVPDLNVVLRATAAFLTTLEFVDRASGATLPLVSTVKVEGERSGQVADSRMLMDPTKGRVRVLWPLIDGEPDVLLVSVGAFGYEGMPVHVRYDAAQIRRHANPVLWLDDYVLRVPLEPNPREAMGGIRIKTPWSALGRERSWKLSIDEFSSPQDNPFARKTAVSQDDSLLVVGVAPGRYRITMERTVIVPDVTVRAGAVSDVVGQFVDFARLRLRPRLHGNKAMEGALIVTYRGKGVQSTVTQMALSDDGLLDLGMFPKTTLGVQVYRSGEGALQPVQVELFAGTDEIVDVPLQNLLAVSPEDSKQQK